MDNRNAKELLKKYHKGQCTDEEKAWLDSWYLNFESSQAEELSEADYKTAEQIIWNNIKPRPQVINIRKWVNIAAAIVLCFVCAGLYLKFVHKPTVGIPAADVKTGKIKPGSNKAILILADGRRVALTDTRNGKIAEQSGVSINKAADGKIIYEAAASVNDNAVALNTVETPRGGQYQIDLPDGTKVWLNAASSLTYPARFRGKERNVTLQGEAYFEVAKNKLMPFKVQANNVNVEVLGTHFNIMSYTDEHSVNTTLLEGSVKISKGNVQKIIKPGQQAVAVTQSNDIVVGETDVDEAVAWKNGNFNFNGDDIHALMRQISRWYDVNVIYQGKIPHNQFVGTIPRASEIEQVLKVLELNHVHVKIKDKTIVVGI